VRDLTTSLDQLGNQYQINTAKATASEQALNQATALLASTESDYTSLAHEASALAASIYVSRTPARNELSRFLSNQTAVTSQNTGVYNKIGLSNLEVKIAAVNELRKQRQHAAETAAAQVKVATDARDAAAQALATAQVTQSRLLSTLSSQDPDVLNAIHDLQAVGDSSIQALMNSGSLMLRQGVANPPAVLASASTALAFLLGQLGKPYLWGGNGPDSFDCSGLVQQAWAAAGVSLPRVAEEQYNTTIPISFSDLQPGDLVFFEEPVGHVGIYIGNGSMIDAPYTGAVIQIDSIFWKNLDGFGRVKAA
jgi:cell wall-associated NlpC family hydrolase